MFKYVIEKDTRWFFFPSIYKQSLLLSLWFRQLLIDAIHNQNGKKKHFMDFFFLKHVQLDEMEGFVQL